MSSGNRRIKVPADLLQNPDLATSVRFLGLICLLPGEAEQISVLALAERSGLAYNTVKAGLAQLKALDLSLGDAGLHEQRVERAERWVFIPAALIVDPAIRVTSKLHYGWLQLLPGFVNSSGEFTFKKLSHLTGMSLNTGREAVKELDYNGWALLERAGKRSPVRFTLLNPVAADAQDEVDQVAANLDQSRFLGQQLMWEWLSVLVDCKNYQDDTAPGFLINPRTREHLQYDRYYPADDVAFEFNGPQHYGPTKKYPGAEAARERETRDLIKIGLSVRNGVTLVTVHPEDLSLEGMLRKIGDLLPLRNLEGQEALVAYLEKRSQAHRRKVERKRREQSSPARG